MRNVKDRLLLLITITLLIVLPNVTTGIKIPFTKSFKDNISGGVESVKDLKNKVPNPIKVADDIAENIPNPIEIAKNISELAVTTAVFTKNNVTLNCLGLPVNLFSKAIEQLFTQTTKAEDVRFYFSSRNQPGNVTVRAGENFTLDHTDYNVRRPTVVLVHGFMSSGKESWLKDMKDAFLKLDDVNVIVVDWQEGSNTWNYYAAAISTRIVGLQIAKLFAQMRELSQSSSKGPDYSRWGSLYFVGHSLGSHISAHAAFLIKESQKDNENKWIVTRITGLDPAQPCFTTADDKLKLDSDDAPFVDVIHTNARHIFFLGLGLPDQLGYVDFYPNGGQVQPGCSNIDTSFWNFLLLPQNIIKETVCSHGRSHTFLTESLIDLASGNCTFIGYKWDRSSDVTKVLNRKCANEYCTEMGVNSASYYPNNTGIYFVPTRDTAPFCFSELDEEDKKALQSHYNKSNSIIKSITKKLF